MQDVPKQLTLNVRRHDDDTFKNFYAADQSPNAEALTQLQQQVNGAGESFVYLWGESGAGLTHLLQASCHYADSQARLVQYLPLKDLVSLAPALILENLWQMDLVCIDDLQAIAGHEEWEEALFNFYNKLRAANKCLLVAATYSPRAIPIDLADLRSRLQWGVTFHIHPLGDEDKIQALKARAHARGLNLSDEVASFITQRCPRNTKQLFQFLNCLDEAAFAEKRKLTIPFVKAVLNV